MCVNRSILHLKKPTDGETDDPLLFPQRSMFVNKINEGEEPLKDV